MSMPLSDDAPGVWSSKGDTFSGNKADHGSGGALAVEGTQVHLSGATICKNNAANDGGGGCLFWDALADDANSPRWASLKPVVDNDTFTSLGNTALFQDQIASLKTFRHPRRATAIFAHYQNGGRIPRKLCMEGTLASNGLWRVCCNGIKSHQCFVHSRWCPSGKPLQCPCHTHLQSALRFELRVLRVGYICERG